MLLEGGFLANWICDRALSCPWCCCGLQYPGTQLKHKYVGQLLLVHGIETLSLQLFSEGVVSVALKRFESGLCIVQLEWQAQTLKQRTPFTNNGLDEHMPSQVLPQNSLGQSFIYPKCKVWVEWYVREVREDGGQLLNQSLSLLTPATISEDFFIMFSNNK